MRSNVHVKGLLDLAALLNESEAPPPLPQPPNITHGKLHDHQKVALGWLVDLHANHRSGGILGDEMGLGKTLSSIAFLAHLLQHDLAQGPFLVVAPLSTLENWEQEFHRFAPSMPVLRYMGDKEERQAMRDAMMEEIAALPQKQQKNPLLASWTVLLTSYELIIADADFLGSKFKWQCLIVDEAHRLKNSNSVLYQTLQTRYKTAFRLLLTGTPLQNSIGELWSLLHFILPHLFSDEEAFKNYFDTIDWKAMKRRPVERNEKEKEKEEEEEDEKDTKIHELQSIIRPFLLRRLKSNVDIKLPNKRELIIYTGLSAMQKKYYKWLLTKDIEKLSFAMAEDNEEEKEKEKEEEEEEENRGGRQSRRRRGVTTTTKRKPRGSRVSLMNIIMQLRKCCNHPYLFDGAEPEFNGEFVLGEHLIENSGKLSLLDKLLPKLQSEGHKVLLFSQMTRMLDIVQDYLHMRGFAYERLDGSVRGEERYMAIESFKSDSESFIFLLSTRAGGLGLNLTAADTVIFLDCDWNPQTDLQAEARVHRIGQTKEVTVIRLVTKFTVEEVILQRALRKLQLSNSVIEEGKFSLDLGNQAKEQEETPQQLFEVIKYGLSSIISDDEASSSVPHPDEDIDAILARSSHELSQETTEALVEAEKEAFYSPTAASSLRDTQTQTQMLSMAEVDENITLERGDDSNNIYYFEGHDYTEETKKADAQAINDLFLLHHRKKSAATSEMEGESSRDSRQFNLRGRTVAFSREEQQTRQSQLRQQRKLKKWQANNYTSTSIPLEAGVAPYFAPSANLPEALQFHILETLSKEERGEEGEEEEQEEKAEEENDIHFLIGDVTDPQSPRVHTTKDEEGEDNQVNALVVVCLDDSGHWNPSHGLFAALDALSPKVRETYEAAAANDDLALGDFHLVPFPVAKFSNINNRQTEERAEVEGDREETFGGFTFVGFVVAQKRKKGVVSGIDFVALTKALEKVARIARLLSAGVHIPRIGATRGGHSDWYSAERSVRKALVMAGIPTYVYYYKRHSRGRNIKRRRQSWTAHDDESEGGPSNTEQDSPQHKHPNREVDEQHQHHHSSKKAKHERPSNEEGGDDSLLFSSLLIYFHKVGQRFDELQKGVLANGGEVQPSFNGNVTHIVTSLTAPDAAITRAKDLHDSVEVVSHRWIADSIQQAQLLPTHAYLLK